jgi:hypothetical protein
MPASVYMLYEPRASCFASELSFGILRGMSPKVLLHTGRMFSVVTGFAGLVCQASGCAYGDLDQVLRAEVATETQCTDVAVKPVPPFERGWKPNQYKVSGCGADRVYDCATSGLVEYASAKDICKVAPAALAPKSAGGEVPPELAPTDGDLETPPPDESPEPGAES